MELRGGGDTETAAGGGTVEDLDWPTAKERVIELRAEIDRLLTLGEYKLSGRHADDWYRRRDELLDEYRQAHGVDAVPNSELIRVRDVLHAELGDTGSGAEERKAAEGLVCEAGRLVDAEVLRRLPPVPVRPSAEDVAEIEAEYKTVSADLADHRRRQAMAAQAHRAAQRGYDHDPELAAQHEHLEAGYAEVWERFAEVEKRRYAALVTDGDWSWRNIHSEVVRAVLAEVRDMGDRVGHGFHASAQKPASDAIRAALDNFPSDWVANSANHPSPIAARHTQGRAHYAHARHIDIKESSPGAPINHHHRCLDADDLSEVVARYRVGDKHEIYAGRRTVKRKIIAVEVDEENLEVSISFDPGRQTKVVGTEVASVVTTDKSPRVTVHEMAHRMEYTNPRITQMESTFYRRRTEGEEARRYTHGEADEIVRPDGFVDEYIGKDYEHNAFEVLSMGMESVFAGSNGALLGISHDRADLDHRAFVLGLIAAV